MARREFRSVFARKEFCSRPNHLTLVVPGDAPLQKDGVNCGVYTLDVRYVVILASNFYKHFVIMVFLVFLPFFWMGASALARRRGKDSHT